ncbi:hypothetical protein BGX28_001082 [Mortierella sp. GBA30]|nr:hypothetical protein BGX28_001082 [Mortierella sp. GBA30]
MQDENAIEAQQSPHSFRASLVKNKSETTPDGMPPQKTPKLSHVPSAQLLESKALHTITNLPRAHPKKPFTKSPMSSSENLHQSIPTPSESQKSNKQQQQQQHLNEDDTISEHDLQTLKALEEALEAVKQSVEQLHRELAQEEAEMEATRHSFQKEQEARTQEEKDAELEMQELEEKCTNLIMEQEKLEDTVYQLTIDVEKAAKEAKELQTQRDELESETEKMLLYGPLQMLMDEIHPLKDLMDGKMEQLEECAQQLGMWQEMYDPLAVCEMELELKQLKVACQLLDDELEGDGMDMDLEAILGLSIEEEFKALKSVHNVIEGSDLDKELTEFQAQMTAKFHRDFAQETAKHKQDMDKVDEKIRHHVERLRKLWMGIQSAKANTSDSEKYFRNTGHELLRLRSENDERRLKIAEARANLAALS